MKPRQRGDVGNSRIADAQVTGRFTALRQPAEVASSCGPGETGQCSPCGDDESLHRQTCEPIATLMCASLLAPCARNQSRLLYGVWGPVMVRLG
jgi:hypothetical protein